MPVNRAAAAGGLPHGVDEVVRSRRKTIAIVVYAGGRVVVRAPLRAPAHLIHTFVESKQDWIQGKKRQALLQTAPAPRKFADGEKFLVVGREIPLKVVSRQRGVVSLAPDALILDAKALPEAEAVLTAWYKAYARQVFTARVDLYARQHGFRFAKIRVSSARTRWGSCSSRGTLSFTWRLVMAPMEVIDYVVVHELAHLKVRDHSPRFWAEVARMMPDYKARLDWLKKNGKFLTLDGVE